ncbi:MAG: flagellar regulator YcgR PilZN domain-containing protein [Wenzhouxiangellaceae bacterium]|nr:flagellar regulator YcgR PilZN domain-containing protein [Wenzhouxiangellaceae bacterium]
MTEGVLITKPVQIRQLLRSLVEGHMLVDVQPLDHESHDSTMLLAFDPRRGLLIFDEPRLVGHGLYDAERTLQFSSQHRGIEIQFVVVSRGIRTFEQRPALFTGWPDAIDYLQRRKAFRISIPKHLESRAELQLDARTTIPMRLMDLSIDGFGAAVDRSAALRVGEVIDCWLEVDHDAFSGSAEVRNFRPLPGRMVRVGAQFLNPERRQQQRVARLIRELERRKIRTQA